MNSSGSLSSGVPSGRSQTSSRVGRLLDSANAADMAADAPASASSVVSRLETRRHGMVRSLRPTSVAGNHSKIMVRRYRILLGLLLAFPSVPALAEGESDFLAGKSK